MENVGIALVGGGLHEERVAENDGVDPTAYLDIPGGAEGPFLVLVCAFLCHLGHSWTFFCPGWLCFVHPSPPLLAPQGPPLPGLVTESSSPYCHRGSGHGSPAGLPTCSTLLHPSFGIPPRLCA